MSTELPTTKRTTELREQTPTGTNRKIKKKKRKKCCKKYLFMLYLGSLEE
jgi:hypothetical protein